MIEELILLTAAYRIDNLRQVYDSIYNAFSKKTDEVHITWVICQDKSNSVGDIDEIKMLCHRGLSEFGMGYLIYPVNTANEKNYGGDLFNEPIKYVKKEWFANCDPWVYILDDDNIVFPSFSNCFNTVSNLSKDKNKPLVWFSKFTSYGVIDLADKRTAFAHPCHGNESEYTVILPDPSQVLMRFSEIEKMGFYDGGLQYDFKIWAYFDANFEKILFPNEWISYNGKTETNEFFTQVQTTHNGMVSNDRIKKAESKKNAQYFLICQGESTDDGKSMSFVLPNEVGNKCFDLTKQYYRGKYFKNGAFDGIDHIYILTQASTPERWNYVIWQFKKLGWYDEVSDKITLIKGVKVPSINENVLEMMAANGYSDLYHRSSNSYNVGFFNCTNEHYRIMKQALAEGYNRVMIIEDDASFIRNPEYFENAIKNVPQDFDILHLEGYLCPINDEEYMKNDAVLSKSIDNAHWKPYSNFKMWCTACMIYSKSGLMEYVRQQEEFLIGVDERTGLIEKNAYFYTYPLVKQEDRRVLLSGIDNKIVAQSTNLYLKYSKDEDYFNYDEFLKETYGKQL